MLLGQLAFDRCPRFEKLTAPRSCQVQNNGGTVAGDYETGGYLRDCDECQRRYAFQRPPYPEHLHRETA